jgi:hypothetical protein
MFAERGTTDPSGRACTPLGTVKPSTVACIALFTEGAGARLAGVWLGDAGLDDACWLEEEFALRCGPAIIKSS